MENPIKNSLTNLMNFLGKYPFSLKDFVNIENHKEERIKLSRNSSWVLIKKIENELNFLDNLGFNCFIQLEEAYINFLSNLNSDEALHKISIIKSSWLRIINITSIPKFLSPRRGEGEKRMS